MKVEEIPIDMGTKAGFWYVVIVGSDVFILMSKTRLAYFYKQLKGGPETTIRKRDAIKGIPAFLEFAKTHSVLKKVKNWNIFGILQ